MSYLPDLAFKMHTLNKKDILLQLLATIMVFAATISIFFGCKNAVNYPAGSFDFQYDSAKVFSMGIDPYEETLQPSGLQETLNLRKYYGILQANQFPSMIMLLLPFTVFRPIVANWIWMICNVLSSVGIVILVKKLVFDECYTSFCQASNFCMQEEEPIWYTILISLFFMGLPWRNNIGNGQHTIMAFFFYLLAIYFSERKKDHVAGVALAISFFKYTLTAPLAIYFLYKKKYKVLAVSIGIHVALTIVAAVWLKSSIWEMIVKPLQIASRFSSSGFVDIGSIVGIKNVGMIIPLLAMLAILIYVMRGKYRGTDSELLTVLTLFSLVIAYHRLYDYFILIIPVIVYSFKKERGIKFILIWIVTLYCFVIRRILAIFIIPASILRVNDVVIACCLYTVMLLSIICKQYSEQTTNDTM